MTKKDYVKIAAALNNARTWVESTRDADGQWAMDVRFITEMLAADNPHFDRTRFLKACGMED